MIFPIPSRHWRRDDGLTCAQSAIPWACEAERPRWTMMTRGWTFSDGAVCHGFAATEAEARARADRWNAEREAQVAAQDAALAPVRAPIEWTRSQCADRRISYHSGEGWAIRVVGRSVYQPDDGTDDWTLTFRSLPAAKSWTEACIRSARQDVMLAQMETSQ